MDRRLITTSLACVVALVGLTGCSGSDPADAAGETSTSTASPSAERSTESDEPTEDPTTEAPASPCEGAAASLDVTYGDPVAYADIFAEGNERTWRHGVPVTVTNASEATCLFEIRGQLVVDGEEGPRFLREIAMRPGQVAKVEDLPLLEDHVPFAPEGEDGVPTADWSVEILRVEGLDLAPDYYDYEVLRTEPNQVVMAEHRAGIVPMHKSYRLDVEIGFNAANPDGKYEDAKTSLLGGSVHTVLHVNGLDAAGNIVATWQLTQGQHETVMFKIPSVGGGELGSGLTARGDVFFNSLDAVESVVEYDVVTVQPLDMLLDD
ncbi:hypothetical protein GCM10011331_21260 [Flavimobilis marinus]|uniref:Uncharacterized protein n=1 Tax=Flavimobilis marinus TaxID=285351 RepID=A0A1I2GW94_9MICO|nr:hypothetical protein [Flavimobilis marinus]GHG54981.1 hypothetical protein GCM10011331_21260 [Flavimobilis marinus]SFF21975.1 hypothetical protein SAMN04488035_2045 [Flavimobilis marinus]